MENNFYIRNVTLNDLNDILKIENDSFIANIREDSETIKERIESFADGFLVLCSKNTNTPIGYISSEIWNYKDNVSVSDFLLGHSIKDAHNIHGNEIYISSMGLLKEVRGKGAGSYLFNSLLNTINNKFPNIKSAILIVSSEWQNAQKIYLKSGFKEICKAPAFFASNNNGCCDGIIMRKIF